MPLSGQRGSQTPVVEERGELVALSRESSVQTPRVRSVLRERDDGRHGDERERPRRLVAAGLCSCSVGREHVEWARARRRVDSPAGPAAAFVMSSEYAPNDHPARGAESATSGRLVEKSPKDARGCPRGLINSRARLCFVGASAGPPSALNEPKRRTCRSARIRRLGSVADVARSSFTWRKRYAITRRPCTHRAGLRTRLRERRGCAGESRGLSDKTAGTEADNWSGRR